MDFAKKLKKRREELGMTQGQLAEEVGVKQSAIHHWERGYRRPRAEHLLALSEALKVTVDYLVRDVELDLDDLLADPRVEEMMKGMLSFREDLKAQLVDYFEYLVDRSKLSSKLA